MSILAAALLLACAACSGEGRVVTLSTQIVSVPDPGPGTINVALLRFDLDAGAAVPALRQANRYSRPPTAVYLAATAPDLTLSNGFIGLVAIADLRGAGQAPQRRSPAKVTASEEFSLVFVGNARFAPAEVAGDQGLGDHGSWSLAWDSAAANALGIGQDGPSLLDEIVAQLQGSTPPQLLAALGGQPVGPPVLAAPASAPAASPSPPAAPGSGTPSQVAAAKPSPKPSLTPSSKASGGAGPAGSGSASLPSGGAPVSGIPTAPLIPLTPPSRLSGSPNPTPGGSPTQNPTAPPSPPPNVLTATVVSIGEPPSAAPTATVSSLTTSCASGSVLTSGGSISDGAAGEGDSATIALVNSVPFSITGGSTIFWQVGTLPGGQPVPDEVTDLSVICLLNGPSPNLVTSTVVPGPSAATSTPQATATATCPAGTIVVGGGGSVVPQGGRAPVGVTMTASYPSAADGSPLTSGTPVGWSVVGTSGGGASTTSAYVICLPAGSIPAVHAAASAPAPPPSAGAPAVAVATCGAGTILLGGGYALAGAPLPDAHVRASYPSSPDGNPVIDAPVSDSWTAITEPERATSVATTTAYALCSG